MTNQFIKAFAQQSIEWNNTFYGCKLDATQEFVRFCFWWELICDSLSQSHILFRFLHDNRLEGTIPSDIGQLAALTQLCVHRSCALDLLVDISPCRTLSDNELVGSLPPSITQLRSLMSLWGEPFFVRDSALNCWLFHRNCARNMLSGSIPSLNAKNW